MSSWVADVREALDEAGPTLDGVCSVHVFGSALNRPDPADLDLLVVYDPNRIPPRRATNLRRVIVSACATVPLRPVEIVLLTAAEAAATNFADMEHAERVYEDRR